MQKHGPLILHIHTKTSVSDSDFVFSIDILKQYVSKMQIEVIAITNHNMFDATQFNDIVQKLTDVVVLPGIEINLSGGHLLLIANNSAIEISDFAKKCNKVSELIVNPTSELTLPQFQTIFPSLSKYLLIPHYDKDGRFVGLRGRSLCAADSERFGKYRPIFVNQ